MRVSLDSSALAKRYLEEPNSDTVEQILGTATSLGLSVVCIPEVISALCRRHREGVISHADYETAKKALLDDVRDADIVSLTPNAVRNAVTALENNALRASDAIHIGSALEWQAELFVSSDDRQIAAATNLGLKTQKV